MMNYLECITKYFPTVFVVCHGDPAIYADLEWDNGDPIPDQAILDARIFQEARDDKITELSTMCQDDIMAGFNSSALGVLRRYDSAEKDQLNLIGAVTKTMPNVAFPDGTSEYYASREIINGVYQPKVYLPHTHVQLRQVLDDGAAYKLAELIKFNNKKTQALNATTLAELNAIVWVD